MYRLTKTLWIPALAVCFATSCTYIQIHRSYLAEEPFRGVGARFYSGADNRYHKLLGPDGVSQIYFEDRSIGDKELIELLPHMKKLPGLGVVHLAGTQVTDEGLQLLAELHLWSVIVRGTKVTPQGIEEFRKHVPGCNVNGMQPEE